MDKSVTAKWARETVKFNLTHKTLEQIKKCETAIRRVVEDEDGKFLTTISGVITSNAKAEFQSRGFKIKQHYNQKDGDFVEISW